MAGCPACKQQMQLPGREALMRLAPADAREPPSPPGKTPPPLKPREDLPESGASKAELPKTEASQDETTTPPPKMETPSSVVAEAEGAEKNPSRSEIPSIETDASEKLKRRQAPAVSEDQCDDDLPEEDPAEGLFVVRRRRKLGWPGEEDDGPQNASSQPRSWREIGVAHWLLHPWLAFSVGCVVGVVLYLVIFPMN